MNEELGIVLVAAPGDWTNMLYAALAARYVIDAVILERPISRIARFRRRAARMGLLRVLDQAAFSILVVPILRMGARTRIAALRELLHADVPLPQDRIVHVDSVNSRGAVAALRDRAPSLVIVSGTRVIAEAVLENVAVPFLNMHAGITPRYRGVHGAYWALAEGRPDLAGVTVHRLDRGIDTGPILAQVRIAPGPHDSFVTYPHLQLQAGIPLMIAAIEDHLAGRPAGVASLDATISKLRYHPGAVGYLARRFSAGVR